MVIKINNKYFKRILNLADCVSSEELNNLLISSYEGLLQEKEDKAVMIEKNLQSCLTEKQLDYINYLMSLQSIKKSGYILNVKPSSLSKGEAGAVINSLKNIRDNKDVDVNNIIKDILVKRS